jgi:hypothetical protein
LRRSDKKHTIALHFVSQRELDIARARRQMDKQEVEISRESLLNELQERAAGQIACQSTVSRRSIR